MPRVIAIVFGLLAALPGCSLEDLNQPFNGPCGDVICVADVAAGTDHTCALTTFGDVYCWGRNDFGQVGPTGTTTVAQPRRVAIGGRASAISAGGHNTCVLIEGGVQCWGDNSQLQLGAPASTPFSAMPLWVGGVTAATSLGVGHSHTCAGSAEGVVCWGQNTACELGIGSEMPDQMGAPGVHALVGPSVAVGAGDGTTCAVSSGELSCWGLGRFLALGNGEPANGCTAARVDFGASDVEVYDVRAGGDPGPMETDHGSHVCATTDRGLYCWGRNESGQVGNTQTDPPADPAPLGFMEATLLATGGHHTCVGSGGHVQCWGAGDFGQLGAGAGITSRLWPPDPDVTPALSGATRLTAGRAHTCAVDVDERVLCWGDNAFAQAGGEPMISLWIPQQVHFTAE